MAAPCALGSLTGAEPGASEPGLVAARAPCTSGAEPQAPGPAGVGLGLAAPALAPGVGHAGAAMLSLSCVPGLPALAELGSPGGAVMAVQRKRATKRQPQGVQHSLPGLDSAPDAPFTVRDPNAMQPERRLAASAPQLSCGVPWQSLGRGRAGNSPVPLARLAAKRRTGAAVLGSFHGVEGGAVAAPDPCGSMAAPDNMLRDAASDSADAAPGLMALERTAPEPPGMSACAPVAAPRPLHSHQDALLQLAAGGSLAASHSGVWRADAGAAAPWPRCSLSASFQGSAGVPEPVACDSPRLRSPTASQGLGFSPSPWRRSPRVRRALLSDSGASAGCAGEAGQAPWTDACSIDQRCNVPGANVSEAASGNLPCMHGAMPAKSGLLDCGAAAGCSDEAGLASCLDGGQPHCKSPGPTNLAAAAKGRTSRARRALFTDVAALPSRPQGCITQKSGGPGEPKQGVASGVALGQDTPCMQGSLEALVPACPAAVPCQRYPCEEASLMSPEPAGVLPPAPMPAPRSPHALPAAPNDAWGCGSSGSMGALCATAEATHAHECGRDRSTAHVMMALRRPLRPLCGISALCQAATARGAHSGAMSCPERGSARSAATRACAKVAPLHMFTVISSPLPTNQMFDKQGTSHKAARCSCVMRFDAPAGRPGLPVSIKMPGKARRARHQSSLPSPFTQSTPSARPAPSASSRRCQRARRAGKPGRCGARRRGGSCGWLGRRVGLAGCGGRRLGSSVHDCCVMGSPSAPAQWQPHRRDHGGG